jgi:hypothetical protein
VRRAGKRVLRYIDRHHRQYHRQRLLPEQLHQRAARLSDQLRADIAFAVSGKKQAPVSLPVMS